MGAKIKRLITILVIFLGPGFVIWFIAKTFDNHFIELPYMGYTYTYNEDGTVKDSIPYQVPDFDLTTFEGETINRDSIRDRFIVLTTIQNSCPELDCCALGLYHFDMLFYEKVLDNDSYDNVQILSVLTDQNGRVDTNGVSPKLKEEMAEYDLSKWWLCTGDPTPFYDFPYYGDQFMNHKASPDDGEIGDLAFTNSLVLIDHEGYIRAVTGSKKDSDIRNFFDMLKLLKKEEFDRNRKKNTRKK